MSRRSESVRGLIPGQACSSCMERRAPSERSWMIRGVHLVAMISAVAATEQLPSCVSFMVRFMGRSLLGPPARSYRSKSDSLGARVLAVEPFADGRCAAPALVDRPDNQRLTAAGIARCEDARDRGRKPGCRDVAARIALCTEPVEQLLLRPEEAHREQDELGWARLLTAGHGLERRYACVALPDDALDGAVAFEPRRRDREVALAALLEGIRGAELHRPARPRRQVVRARGRRLADQLDLRHRGGPFAVCVRDAVGARVTAADHDDVLAGGRDRRCRCAVDDALPLGQVLHREVDAGELSPGHEQVARDARAGGHDDRVVLGAELGDVDVDADFDTEPELDALGGELSDAALDELLLDLELRHAEAHKATGRLVALVDRHPLACARELLGARKAGRPGADHRDAPPRRRGGGQRHDPALGPGPVDDRELDLLDRDRVAFVDLQHARRLAGCGAQPPRELGEVVRAVQLLARLGPAVAVDEVVPVRDQVADRAAVVTERHAALHAAGSLRAQVCERQRADELADVADALAGGAAGRFRAAKAEEGPDLAHQAASSDSLVTKPTPPAETG